MNQHPTSDPSPAPDRRSHRGWPRGPTLPGPAFRALAGSLLRSGASGRESLREAGRIAGELLYGAMDEGGAMPPAEFWAEVRRLAASAGLGRPEYAVLAPGVGSITLADGPEVERPDSGACHFAAGWLGGVLTRAAGEPVAILEVRCAALGPGEECRFLVGSEARLREVRRDLEGGASLARSVAGSGGEGRRR